MAQVPRLQDRGGREREGPGQVRLVLDAGGEGLIKRVAAGKAPIAKIFSEEQEDFLVAMAGRAIDFSTLAVLGPLKAQRWEFKDPHARGDHRRAVEARRREATDGTVDQGAVAQTAVAVGGFMALLAEVGVERDRKEQSKTRWALDYYVAKLARPRGRRVPCARSEFAGLLRRPAVRSVTVRMNAVPGEFAASITKYPCLSNWNLSSAFASLSEGSRYARITFRDLD